MSSTLEKKLRLDLPVLSYEETKAGSYPTKIDSEHIELNNREITKLGLKPGSTWKDQSEEFHTYLNGGEYGKARRVLWIRHGEGLHNAAEREVGKEKWETHESKLEKYFDPDLNHAGFDQSLQLRGALKPHLEKGHLNVDLIIVSPLTRAIRTAEIAFGEIWENTPVVAVELARERFGKNVCDRRRSVQELKKMFPKVNFDEYMVSEEDSWYTEVRETPEEVRERVKRLMRWIMDIPHPTIAVVGHSDFMSHAVEVAGFDPHWPANCELVPMMLGLEDEDVQNNNDDDDDDSNDVNEDD